MTIGILCEPYKKSVTFEECSCCAQCLTASIIKSLRIYDYAPQRNVYFLKEIIRCLRKAYLSRKATPVDSYISLRSLYAIKRGKVFGNMVDGSRWKELDGSMSFEVDREDVKLTARIDSYEPEKATIIELKSLEGVENKKLPRKNDILQIQGYSTIFKTIIPVRKLTIVYLDMNNFRQFDAEDIDLTNWLTKRVFTLHRGIRDSQTPAGEPSFECKYCEHQKRCIVPPLVSVPRTETQTSRSPAGSEVS